MADEAYSHPLPQQLAVECLDRLSVGADDVPLATDQRDVCLRYLQRLVLRISSQRIDQQQVPAGGDVAHASNCYNGLVVLAWSSVPSSI